MELRHLRYFLAVAETGSLTVAAEQRLHTSQPSLSRQIRDLEDQVGAELFRRSPRGVELTEAGRAFLDPARLALTQVEAAVEAARRAARPSRPRFALGFLTGQEMHWLPKAMAMLHDQLPHVDISVTSNYSPDLAEAVARHRLDLAFLRAEPGFDLDYVPVSAEPLVVLMPSDHPLTRLAAVRPQDLAGHPFVGMANKAGVLRSVIDRYLDRANVVLAPAQGVDNLAMVMSLVASTHGLALMPAYAQGLMPASVVSRPLVGEAPTIDLVVGYSRANRSPVLARFLARLPSLAADGSKVRGSDPAPAP